MPDWSGPVLHSILALHRVKKFVIRGSLNDPPDYVGTALEVLYVNPGLPVDLPPGNSGPKESPD